MATKAMAAFRIERNNADLIFTWAYPAGVNSANKRCTIEYKFVQPGQKLEKATKYKWKATAAEAGITTKTIAVDLTQFYPSTEVKVDYIWARIHYADQKWLEQTLSLKVPNQPVLSLSGFDFSWVTEAYGTAPEWLVDVEYQTISSTTTDYNAVNWSAATKTSAPAIGSYTASEASGISWFRCRGRGLAGDSAWSYNYVVKNTPLALTNVEPAFNEGTLAVKVTNTATKEHPVEQIKVYYRIGNPLADLQPPTGDWVLGKTYDVGWKEANNNAITTFIQNLTIEEDQCLWVRVDALCADNVATGEPIWVAGGELVAPTISACSWNTVTREVSMTVANNSVVPGVQLAMVFSDGKVIAVADGDETIITASYSPSSGVTEATFGLFAFYGQPSDPQLSSEIVWQTQDTSVPQPPASVSASILSLTEGRIEVDWAWSWAKADAAILSWATHDDAWMSTSEPQEYEVDGKTTKWIIDELEPGQTYYIKIRLMKRSTQSDQPDELGPWSKLLKVDLGAAPDAPAISVSDTIIAPNEALTVAWAYLSSDTTAQKSAEVYVDDVLYQSIDGAAQSVTFTPNWTNGSTHTVRVRTESESGKLSSLSSAIAVKVANAPTITVNTSLVSDELRAMPLTLSVGGAGTGGMTTVSITRAGNCSIERPDGSVLDGFDGETIFTAIYSGQLSSHNIRLEDITGRLDDGCAYWLTCTVYDELGQSVTNKQRFVVAWTHQAEAPTASVVIDGNIAKITPTAPASFADGDICEIYRLSKDRPELVVRGEFGTTYVDPYPASGGGYRVVDVTKNGDYMAAKAPAWVDIEHDLVFYGILFDFDEGEQISLPYNIELKNDFEKDFKRTRYLNGSLQGDWNAGIERDTALTTVIEKTDDVSMAAVRELAAYAGICHVRTPEGSSFDADVQVSESGEYSSALITYELKCQRIDPEGEAGMTLADWEEG